MSAPVRSSSRVPTRTVPPPVPHGLDRVAVALAKLIDAVNLRRHGAQNAESNEVAA